MKLLSKYLELILFHFILSKCTIYKNTLKGEMDMYEYTISVTFQGKQYQTNVIAEKDSTEQEVYQLALEQVKKQWGFNKELPNGV